MKQEIQETLRKEVEKCSCLEGFIITRSMSTYNACGLGSCLLELLNEYDKTAKIDFRLYPDHLNPSLSEEDAFNAALATSHAMNVDTGLSVCLDSGALRGICTQNLDIKNPTFNDICHLSAYLLESLTIPIRHKGQINGGLKDMAKNLVPFPRLNFLIPAIAPIVCEAKFKRIKQDTASLTSSLFSSQNQFINCGNLKDQIYKHLASYISYQGVSFDLAEIDDSIEKLSKMFNFADFTPAKFRITSHTQVPQPTKTIFNNKNSILGLINSTTIKNVLNSIRNKSMSYVDSESFLSKYSENKSCAIESIDELKFLIDEYEIYSQDQCEGFIDDNF